MLYMPVRFPLIIWICISFCMINIKNKEWFRNSPSISWHIFQIHVLMLFLTVLIGKIIVMINQKSEKSVAKHVMYAMKKVKTTTLITIILLIFFEVIVIVVLIHNVFSFISKICPMITFGSKMILNKTCKNFQQTTFMTPRPTNTHNLIHYNKNQSIIIWAQ